MMLNEDQTDSSDKAAMAAVIAGGFAWLVFDGFIFALIVGFVAFVIVNRKKVARDDSEENI
ncbi:hypothetical protein [Litorimonas sp. WD9-15]|uniref:hypothetical protein n=1 Tax=Litorimonas sp. WD9-15 TaxID=3418716 RepID=UPI003D0224BD